MIRSTQFILLLAAALFTATVTQAWHVPSSTAVRSSTTTSRTTTTTSLSAVSTEKETKESVDDVESTTEKYGLEAGLFQSAKAGDGESAKSLLKKYGIAYLATSIPLALISFIICYALVDQGVDVSSLLAKVGIEGAATEKAGTFAIAYAAHKAASPIRFPPTVILTPMVAKLLGKEPEAEEVTSSSEE
eukprot:CAMPEP_0194046654 /NCGR_PEP_ID=MMETSP0009_2-20130614/22098_1 /TAXON_ID=210454 /ORGANISM="Grammatophora oceanica, Strain CCMP 410" /LENGTH=188 /DNA_ID=CAMNT_0038692031 /DNA_START=159 /DNA_END=725 /DNA_ORIENTATION=-